MQGLPGCFRAAKSEMLNRQAVQGYKDVSAPLHRQPRRLVYDQELCIFVQNPAAEVLAYTFKLLAAVGRCKNSTNVFTVTG